MLTLSLTEKEERKMTERGEVCGVVSRVRRGKKVCLGRYFFWLT